MRRRIVRPNGVVVNLGLRLKTRIAALQRNGALTEPLLALGCSLLLFPMFSLFPKIKAASKSVSLILINGYSRNVVAFHNFTQSQIRRSAVYFSTGASDDSFKTELNPADDLIPLEDPEAAESSITKPSIPENITEVLGVPVTRRPLFPGFYKTLSIKNPKVSNTITSMLRRGQPWIGIFLQNDETRPLNDQISALPEIKRVGVFAQVVNIFQSSNGAEGGFTAIVYPHRRIRATDVVKAGDGTLSKIQIENVVEDAYDKRNRVLRAISQEIFAVLSDIAKLNSFFREHIMHHNVPTAIFEDPAKLADFVSILTSAEADELQDVLECSDIEARLRKALELLKKELVTAQLQNSIAKDVETKLSQKQREYFLHEQLKVIKKELGLEADSKDKLIETFKEKASHLVFPESVKKIFDEEITKLSVLEPSGSEFNVIRNYLDWLTVLPWGKSSSENLEYSHAEQVLNADHYGLEDVKNRILEFIAVGKLKGTVQGKILCLIGPPGVGKTSIGRSIARALNRNYYRFSVGGLSDVSEIKGHRRTYVGAMPGKVVQALKSVQSENPLILIDEVDKIGRGSFQGDPSSALLELLDPEQNKAFLDHYLDVPLDLSKVLFVCTANVADTIPAPLLDRMEVINLSGYVAEEKKEIAKQYLIPIAIKESGLENVPCSIQDSALDRLIRFYCRENGVRNLKKHIEKVFRKIALKVVKGESPTDSQIAVDWDNLVSYVGQPAFSNEKIFPDQPPVGVVMGLAWTPMGGSVLYIETVAESMQNSYKVPNSAAALTRTGHLGKVMEESSTIAYTFAKDFLRKIDSSNAFFYANNIHLHVPEGAISKDGPSAGVTMTSSLLSLALGRPIRSGLAMTGELTLTGKVLKIGGLKEKTIAARNAGVKDIVFPAANFSDWNEFPDYIRAGITPHPVENYSEIFEICFEKK